MDLKHFIPKEQYRFHYEKLNRTDQAAYAALLEGILRFDGEISLHVPAARLQKIYDAVCRDVPEVFFARGLQSRFFRYDTGTCRVLMEYRFDPETCGGMLQEMEETIRPLLEKLRGKSELEKEKMIHDHLIDTVTYKDKEMPYSHEAAGPILYGIGVCEGISKAFKFIADRCGLRSMLVYGTSCSSYNIGADDGGGHAWNAVRIGRDWYHLDVTFDASLTDQVRRYDYFNLSSRQISVDHQYEAAPLCPNGMNYYRTIGRFAATSHELKAMAKEHLTASAPLVFQLPEKTEIDPEKLPDVLLDVLLDSVWYRSFFRGVTLSYNLDRMVFQAQIGKDSQG